MPSTNSYRNKSTTPFPANHKPKNPENAQAGSGIFTSLFNSASSSSSTTSKPQKKIQRSSSSSSSFFSSSSSKKKPTQLKEIDPSTMGTSTRIALWMMGTTPEKWNRAARAQKRRRMKRGQQGGGGVGAEGYVPEGEGGGGGEFDGMGMGMEAGVGEEVVV
ncbi:hypothetical protein VTK26DRAFT_2772 [Humicola hyalothermophila]